MSPDSINVIKRNGRGTEPLNLEKIHEMVAHACKDLTGVSESQVEMSSGIQFFDKISTDEIQQILIKSASDLITLEIAFRKTNLSSLICFSSLMNLFSGLSFPKFQYE